MEEEKNVGGRPSSYKPEYDKQVYKLCLLGATDAEIADFFGVVKQTIYNWKEENPRFLDSIKRGKLTADANVAKSLYKRATGFKYDEVVFEKIDKESNLEISEAGVIAEDNAFKIKVTKKYIIPDVAAQNIWLKNRRGKVNDAEGQRWADKHEHEVTKVKTKVSFKDEPGT